MLRIVVGASITQIKQSVVKELDIQASKPLVYVYVCVCVCMHSEYNFYNNNNNNHHNN